MKGKQIYSKDYPTINCLYSKTCRDNYFIGCCFCSKVPPFRTCMSSRPPSSRKMLLQKDQELYWPLSNTLKCISNCQLWSTIESHTLHYRCLFMLKNCKELLNHECSCCFLKGMSQHLTEASLWKVTDIFAHLQSSSRSKFIWLELNLCKLNFHHMLTSSLCYSRCLSWSIWIHLVFRKCLNLLKCCNSLDFMTCTSFLNLKNNSDYQMKYSKINLLSWFHQI